MKQAARDYRHAMQSGDTEGAMLAKRRYDYLKSGGIMVLAVFLLLACSGCRTTTAKPPVVLSEHASFPLPGSIVPPLPEGQVRWLLLSVPTGVEMMLPTDFPLADLEPTP
jgi:hypothetical protein